MTNGMRHCNSQMGCYHGGAMAGDEARLPAASWATSTLRFDLHRQDLDDLFNGLLAKV